MAMADPGSTRELDALDHLISTQEATLLARTRRSHELHQEASAHLPGGVASSWQDAPPCPIFVERGAGSRIWDVDGNEYVDLHGGFGTTIAGHGHPAIVAAVSARAVAGTHFAQPVPDIIPVARELSRRFGLPLWRFTNSGTEATLAAVHLIRARPGDRRSSRSRAATTDTTTRYRCRCTPTSTPPAPRTGHTRCPSTSPSRRARGPSPTSCRSAGSTPSGASCSITPGRSPA